MWARLKTMGDVYACSLLLLALAFSRFSLSQRVQSMSLRSAPELVLVAAN